VDVHVREAAFGEYVNAVRDELRVPLARQVRGDREQVEKEAGQRLDREAATPGMN
jgi:hypothetical protein